MNIKDCLNTLQQLGTPERALANKSYNKSQRVHWGVPVPDTTKVARTFAKDLSDTEVITFAKALWETNLFDPMICALKMLTLPRVRASEALWNTVLAFLKQVDGWALEDQMAHAAWKCILHDPSLLDQVEGWTEHPNFWMRRAALVYTLPFAKPGRDPERMLSWASLYAPDPEWFIQKAIGWWLRVLGEHNPERVVQFLSAHWTTLKGVARKEGTRKLSTEFQKFFE